MNYTKDYFDTYTERRGTRSLKWDGCNRKFGLNPSIEMLPMWIADMDFKAPSQVVEAVTAKAREGIYGYSTKPDSFYDSIVNWIGRRYGWEVQRDWIVFTPGVIPGFTIAIQQFTEPGDGIIVQPPVYYPFMDGVKNNGRRLVENPLLENGGYYKMDFEDLEQKARNPDNKLLILSNPHNPVGRRWTKGELERLGTICADNGVIIVSDEIHADLMLEGFRHQALSPISEKIAEVTVTNYSPSKTFNLAGLQTAYMIISSSRLRERFLKGLNANRIFNMNWFGPVALETAYNQCEDYVTSLCDYVEGNATYMARFLSEKLPRLSLQKPQATYLAWVDFKGTGMTPEEIEYFIVHKARLGVDLGTWFGTGGGGFLRFNLACPRVILERAMKQLEQAFK